MPRRRGGKKHKKKPMATCPICYEREPEMFFECDRCKYKMCSHCSNKLQTAVYASSLMHVREPNNSTNVKNKPITLVQPNHI